MAQSALPGTDPIGPLATPAASASPAAATATTTGAGAALSDSHAAALPTLGKHVPASLTLLRVRAGGITIQTYTPVTVNNPLDVAINSPGSGGGGSAAGAAASAAVGAKADLVQSLLASRPARIIVVPLIIG